MHHEDGTRCMFVFTSKQTISDFVELMEMPRHKQFSAIPFETNSLLGFLREIGGQVEAIALDPLAYCEFTPVAIDDFVSTLNA